MTTNPTPDDGRAATPIWPSAPLPPVARTPAPPPRTPVPPRPTPSSTSTSRRRKHPAQAARVAALVASIGATGAIGAVMVVADRPADLTTTAASGVAAATSRAVAPATAASRTRTTTRSAKASGVAARYRDGVFTGTAEYTRWGDLQVQVTIAAGKVAAVQAVRSPSDGKSQRINQRAQPVLEREAIAAQSAKIDAVSGASYTSRSYVDSLQAALDLAAGRAGAAAP